MKTKSRPTPLAPDPAALRGRLVEGRAKNALPAGLQVITAGQVKPKVGLLKTSVVRKMVSPTLTGKTWSEKYGKSVGEKYAKTVKSAQSTDTLRIPHLSRIL